MVPNNCNFFKVNITYWLSKKEIDSETKGGRGVERELFGHTGRE